MKKVVSFLLTLIMVFGLMDVQVRTKREKGGTQMCPE